MNGNDPVAIVKRLAPHEWKWDKIGIANTLLSLGWEQRISMPGRDGYVVPPGTHASVYNDGNHAILIEVEIDVFRDVDSLDELAYEDKIDEFHEKFFNATKQLAEHLGRPIFSDGAAANGFPGDQDAVWLSLWHLPTARLMVQLKHEGREIPFRLCVVVAPPVS